jgi:hypothetical protein
VPKLPQLRRRPHRQHRSPPTLRLRPSSLRWEPVPGRAFRRSSTPLRGCSRSASRGLGLRRKTSRCSEGFGLSSRARLSRPSKSRRCGRLRLRRSRPSSTTQRRRTSLQTPSTSISGKRSAISLCFRVRSPARRRRSRPSLRRSLQHRWQLRKPRRRLSSTSGTPCRPCRLSWISGGSRRTRSKGKASTTDRSVGSRWSTSYRMTHCSATSSWYPRFQSSSKVHRSLVASTPTPYPSTTGTTTPKSSL